MGTQPLNARAGPSAAQCTALDGIGQAVTFNPTAPGNPTPASVDAGHALAAVACPAAGQCTAVDANRRAVTFNPGSPGTTLISSGGEVTFNPASAIAHNPTLVATGSAALACTSAGQCTAVGLIGQEVTLTRPLPDPRPNAAGAGCVPIAGAMGPTYTLTTADVGSTILVSESATNAGGTGGPVNSAVTGVVQSSAAPPTAPSNQSAPAISGAPTGELR